MDNTAQVKVRRVFNQNTIFHVPVDSSTVLDEGDLVKISSNKAVHMDSSADTCYGFVIDGSADGDDQPVTVGKEGVLEIEASTDFNIGDTGVYTAGGASADWTVGSGGTDTYVESTEELTSGDRGRFYFKS